jgi:phosphate:Na+ symporter
MTIGVKPLADSVIFKNIFIRFNTNPILAVIAGAIVTAIIQSSSVTTGIVLTLASLNLITLSGAVPLILGCNIGTCATALLACIGTSTNAKRTAVAHLFFNVFGTLIFLPFIHPFTHLIRLTSIDLARQCANAHTIFNVTCTLLILPFTKLYSKFIIKLVKEKHTDSDDYADTKYLENHLLHTPSIAIEAATKEIIKTLELSKIMIQSVINAFSKNDIKFLETIEQKEEIVDTRRYAITSYLVRLMEENLSHEESIKIPALIHIVNDVERIGDHAINLRNLIKQKIENKLSLSDDATQGLMTMYKELLDMIESSIFSLQSNKVEDAQNIVVKEQMINELRTKLKSDHINRLKQGQCDVLAGIIFIDIVNNFEKIGDHLKNIGDAILDDLQWHKNSD